MLEFSARALLQDDATSFVGVVREVLDDGSLLVADAIGDLPECVCERLVTSVQAPVIAPRDLVLCWRVPGRESPTIVLGRIGETHGRTPLSASASAAEKPAACPDERSDDIPDELVLEAKQQLTLRVGDGSITLRADGKIQIKGRDLVSHAQRLNRIKGGAVSIN
jgi:hypothetical protein